MYPIKFKPIYKEKIWGGPELASFRKDVPSGNIGESWEISCHYEGVSVVSNGEFKGMKFDELLKTRSRDILGTDLEKNGFQLLLKIINSNDKLSIQVHPDDKYAGRIENENGKNEMWYVLDAKKDSELVLGFKDCDRKKFKTSLEAGTVEKCFKRKKIKKGDVYFVKAGLVHAIFPGSLIVEIQQSSDLTYRIHDYGRGRELHVDKALDVIDFKSSSPLIKGKNILKKDHSLLRYISNKYFTMEKIIFDGEYKTKSNMRKYFIFLCLEGKGEMIYNGNESESIVKGESFLIPAALGAFNIVGSCELLKIYV